MGSNMDQVNASFDDLTIGGGGFTEPRQENRTEEDPVLLGLADMSMALAPYTNNDSFIQQLLGNDLIDEVFDDSFNEGKYLYC